MLSATRQTAISSAFLQRRRGGTRLESGATPPQGTLQPPLSRQPLPRVPPHGLRPAHGCTPRSLFLQHSPAGSSENTAFSSPSPARHLPAAAAPLRSRYLCQDSPQPSSSPPPARPLGPFVPLPGRLAQPPHEAAALPSATSETARAPPPPPGARLAPLPAPAQ